MPTAKQPKITPLEKIEQGLPLTQKEIEGFNDSFRQWPCKFAQCVNSEGEGSLNFAVYRSLPCGCRVIGNGSIPFPLTVKPCQKHTQ